MKHREKYSISVRVHVPCRNLGRTKWNASFLVQADQVHGSGNRACIERLRHNILAEIHLKIPSASVKRSLEQVRAISWNQAREIIRLPRNCWRTGDSGRIRRQTKHTRNEQHHTMLGNAVRVFSVAAPVRSSLRYCTTHAAPAGAKQCSSTTSTSSKVAGAKLFFAQAYEEAGMAVKKDLENPPPPHIQRFWKMVAIFGVGYLLGCGAAAISPIWGGKTEERKRIAAANALI